MEAKQSSAALLLERAERGDSGAVEELFTLLYAELHELARRQRHRWRGDYTLDTTALVHEAYLKLAGPGQIRAESRAHFAAVAARAMRHILCNYSRHRGALKRGGGMRAVTLDEDAARAAPVADAGAASATLLALDEALRRLEREDPRRSRVVECRFFGGMTIDETAAALGTSARTVKRDWAVAQAWLHRELGGAGG
jgi:RNA polymerase sigma factor (TIGR02999 family)